TVTLPGGTTTVVQTAAGSVAYCACTVTLGGVIDYTGSQANYGTQNKVAIDDALADVNAWAASAGYTVKFAIVQQDDQTDPAVALQKLQTLAAQGIQVVIGPYFSGAAANMLPYANSNHILMISPQSTSPSLNNRSSTGYLIRDVPPDSDGALGLATAAHGLGIKDVVVVYRQDTWGQAYVAAFNSSAIGLGMKASLIPYTPVTTGAYDFSAALSVASGDYSSDVSSVGVNSTAIVHIGFEEYSAFLQQAQSLYPNMLKSLFFNTDAADQGVISTDGATAVAVKSISTVFQPTDSGKFTSFQQRIQTQLGTLPNTYVSTSYDAVWIAALSILAAGKYDGAAVKAVVTTVANNYFGVAGWPNINANGDRTGSDYGVWEVVNSASPQWAQIGTFAGGAISYSQTP
ncbi:MAG TPA: ABC transporter substrate-binding protein, partial [Nitrososphaerales archaeon]|nr:ABC transporter substrate-binding protein [Nitrososphaerales archaeon]